LSIRAPWNDLLAEPLRKDHIVQLYQDERAVIDAIALFTEQGLGKGDAVVLVATPRRRDGLERSLVDSGFHVEGLKRRGQLTLLDAQTLLSRFMVDGGPDRALFQAAIAGIVETARCAGRHPRVRVYGEMVDLLWKPNLSAATRLEELWNEAIKLHGISLFCAYGIGHQVDEQDGFPAELRMLHTHLIPVEASA
jgi:hypothetical protein